MGKKRRASRSDSEESNPEEDEVMNDGGDASDEDEAVSMNDADHSEDDDDDDDLPTPSPIIKKDMKLRSGRRKRRRSVGTTGLTPPATLRKNKRSRISMPTPMGMAAKPANGDMGDSPNGDRKPSSVAFADSVVQASNGPAETPVHEFASVPKDTSKSASTAKSASTTGSPGMVPDPRRISYSAVSRNVSSTAHDEQSGSSSDDDEQESNEIDAIPPKLTTHTNGKTQSDSTPLVAEQPVAECDGKDKEDDKPNDDSTPKEAVVTSTGRSMLQRLVIFAILGYISLLFSMPQVVKFSENMVPLDDSVVGPPPILVRNVSLPEPEEEEENDEEEVQAHAMAALQSWNKRFLDDFKTLNQAKNGYSSSMQSLEDYSTQLLDRFDKIQAQLRDKQTDIEARLNSLNLLEELLIQADEDKWDQARDLSQQLLGENLLTTSSIKLWDVPDDIDVDCALTEEDNGDVDSLEEKEEEDLEPLLLPDVLEETISALSLRSTITAEKFIGGTVAEARIRTWVKSLITMIVDKDDETVEVIDEIKEFGEQLSRPATKSVNSGLPLSQIIQTRLDVHRADITGIYDYASLKNGAEVIYGGKRGTSKSLIDELPVVNRILQNSHLRFYGFGPEAALTATYPPSSLGQCWSFRQTPLKDQLKERQLFENDEVPNDFKRGNFGTLTIRLSEPTLVDSVIIEHPPLHLTGQAGSAIRYFRVVGYEDELASSKAWNLGSFEYKLKENRQNNNYLQTFEAATTVFGKEIPPLHSISLAVDSNHGHDYSCLYRFRVHGSKE